MILILIYSLFFTPQETDPVLKPVRDLFKGMETADSTLVRSAFLTDAQMRSVVETPEGTKIQSGDLDRFVKAIGTSTRKLAEPIWNIKVEIDGPFAQVWAEYALYIDGEFHHCGVDAFQLIKKGEEWKIMLITDTRRTEDCKVPEEVSDQFKN